MEQLTLFDLFPMKQFKIDKPIRLIELFGGIGSQAMALRNLGADFEHYRMVEVDKYAVASYNAIHGTEFVPTDITEVHGRDLGITDTEVIKIPDTLIKIAKDNDMDVFCHPAWQYLFLRAIKDGTLLPKKHGRLIDTNALTYSHTKDGDVVIYPETIAETPTIIEEEKDE